MTTSKSFTTYATDYAPADILSPQVEAMSRMMKDRLAVMKAKEAAGAARPQHEVTSVEQVSLRDLMVI